MKKYISIIVWMLFASILWAQPNDRIAILEQQLDVFAKKHKAIKRTAEIDINADIKELAASIAESQKLNIIVANDVNVKFNNVLPDVPIKDLLLLLCKQYNLTLDFTGSIITIQNFKTPEVPAPDEAPPVVTFTDFNSRISISANDHTLGQVLELVTQQSGINVVPDNAIRDQKVSIKIDKALFREAIDLLAKSNNLKVNRVRGGSYLLTGQDIAVNPVNNPTNNRPNNNRRNPTRSNGSQRLDIIPSVTSSDTITELIAENAAVDDIIKRVSEELNKNFVIIQGAPDIRIPNGGGNVRRSNNNFNNNNNNQNNSNNGGDNGETLTFQLRNVAYTDLLDVLLRSSNSTYRFEDDIYYIGKQSTKGFQTTKIIQLQHRPYKDVIGLIPGQMKSNGFIEIDTFPELNSLILSGEAAKIREIENFVSVVDKRVPNVTIELIIMDAQKNNLVDLGVQAGVGTEPSQGSGQLFPGTDFTFSAGAVNNLLDLLAGQGVVNLGQVNQNFYLSLKAIEENGYVKITSKPQLATLNASPARFKIGETRYFRNEQSNISPGITPIIQNNFQFEQLEANFSIDVTPIVSGDEQVTLDILVEQTDFIGEVQENAPSPQVTREFNSILRVKNGEMIVLGGLERKQKNETGSGVPLLARIPIIKWFFSRRTKSKQDSKLLIFIKPTVQF